MRRPRPREAPGMNCNEPSTRAVTAPATWMNSQGTPSGLPSASLRRAAAGASGISRNRRRSRGTAGATSPADAGGPGFRTGRKGWTAVMRRSSWRFRRTSLRAGRGSLGLTSRTAPGLRERDGWTQGRPGQVRMTRHAAVGDRPRHPDRHRLADGIPGAVRSERIPVLTRYVYWMICMVGGGLIGIVAGRGSWVAESPCPGGGGAGLGADDAAGVPAGSRRQQRVLIGGMFDGPGIF
jgi:hypothetical protein